MSNTQKGSGHDALCQMAVSGFFLIRERMGEEGCDRLATALAEFLGRHFPNWLTGGKVGDLVDARRMAFEMRKSVRSVQEKAHDAELPRYNGMFSQQDFREASRGESD